MRIKIGGLDLIKLNLGILEKLMEKEIISPQETEDILKAASDPELIKQGKAPYQVIKD